MRGNQSVLRAAFPYTLPVLTGYAFLGLGFGVLMSSAGYAVPWSVLMSTVVFAGSGQYVAVTLLRSPFNPLYAFLLTLLVNARHLFYGVPLLEKFSNTGKRKPYLIFGLTDETFSLLCTTEPPPGIDRVQFMFSVTLLNHCYWLFGSTLGALLGSLITFNNKGLDFVLTALFVVIFLEQWKGQRNHVPAVIGITCSALCLAVFGPDHFIIPAMIAIVATLMLGRSHITGDVRQ